jgi:catechol 2,3-dioxygenase-like lactoylglutathione lyase family enzyme
MAKGMIRHVAVCTENTTKLAEFYKTTFGMEEVARGQEREEHNTAIYLSDGYINLAVLPSNGRKEGIDHFGFQVEDIRATGAAAKEAGAAQGIMPRPRDGRFAEFRFLDPVGTPIDLSEGGWKTEPTPAGSASGVGAS